MQCPTSLHTEEIRNPGVQLDAPVCALQAWHMARKALDILLPSCVVFFLHVLPPESCFFSFFIVLHNESTVSFANRIFCCFSSAILRSPFPHWRHGTNARILPLLLVQGSMLSALGFLPCLP